jgi:type I restriction enzyme M protein
LPPPERPKNIQIYDSTSGSGSLLLNIGQAIAKHMADQNNIRTTPRS